MAFCMNCGTALPEGSAFCHVCGSKSAVQARPVQQVQAQPVPQPQPVMQQPVMQQPVMQQPVMQQPVMQPPAKKKRRAPLIITLVLFFVLAVTGTLLWLFLAGPLSYTRSIRVPSDWEGVAYYSGISGLSDNADRTAAVYGYFEKDANGVFFQLYEDPQMKENLLLSLYIDNSDPGRFVPDLKTGTASLMDMSLSTSDVPGLTAALEKGELRLKCGYRNGDLSVDCEFVIHEK